MPFRFTLPFVALTNAALPTPSVIRKAPEEAPEQAPAEKGATILIFPAAIVSRGSPSTSLEFNL